MKTWIDLDFFSKFNFELFLFQNQSLPYSFFNDYAFLNDIDMLIHKQKKNQTTITINLQNKRLVQSATEKLHLNIQ